MRVAVVFLAPYVGFPLSVDASYVLLSNWSAQAWPLRRPFSNHTALVKRALDAALLLAPPPPYDAPNQAMPNVTAHSNEAVFVAREGAPPPRAEPPPLLDFSLRGFPSPPVLNADGFDAFGASGAQWTFLGPAILCFHVLTALAGEKESGLRQLLRSAGMGTPAYMATGAALVALVSALSTALLLAVGGAMGVPFFARSTPLATGACFFLTCAAYAALAAAAAGFARTASAAASLAAGLTLCSYVRFNANRPCAPNPCPPPKKQTPHPAQTPPPPAPTNAGVHPDCADGRRGGAEPAVGD